MRRPVPLIVLKRLILLGLVWLVLTGGDAEGLLLGALAVPLAAWLSLRLLPPDRPLRLGVLAGMLPHFLWRSLLGGGDVAWRAFHPRLPLKPGWRRLPVRLPAGATAVLGGEFSLMPGTLVAGCDQGRLLVHMLDTDQPIEETVRLEEAKLAAVLASPEERPR